jgi:hypothetical protein
MKYSRNYQEIINLYSNPESISPLGPILETCAKSLPSTFQPKVKKFKKIMIQYIPLGFTKPPLPFSETWISIFLPNFC